MKSHLINRKDNKITVLEYLNGSANTTKSVALQSDFEDLCHEQAFKGTDHLSRSVHTQLIPTFIEKFNAWLDSKSAGKSGKMKTIFRECKTPVPLIASNVLKNVFAMQGAEMSTIVHKLTRAFIIEEEYQASIEAIKESQNKALAKKTAKQAKFKPTFSSKQAHIRESRKRLAGMEEFDQTVYRKAGVVLLDLVLNLNVYTQGKTFSVFELADYSSSKDNHSKPKGSRCVIFSDKFNEWFGLKIYNVQQSAFGLKPTLISLINGLTW